MLCHSQSVWCAHRTGRQQHSQLHFVSYSTHTAAHCHISSAWPSLAASAHSRHAPCSVCCSASCACGGVLLTSTATAFMAGRVGGPRKLPWQTATRLPSTASSQMAQVIGRRTASGNNSCDHGLLLLLLLAGSSSRPLSSPPLQQRGAAVSVSAFPGFPDHTSALLFCPPRASYRISMFANPFSVVLSRTAAYIQPMTRSFLTRFNAASTFDVAGGWAVWGLLVAGTSRSRCASS